MMHVAAFIARRSAAFAAKPAIGGHEIDHRSAGAHLYQAVLLTVTLDATTENVAIELNGPRQIADTQHDMVKATNSKYGHMLVLWSAELLDAAPNFKPAQVQAGLGRFQETRV